MDAMGFMTAIAGFGPIAGVVFAGLAPVDRVCEIAGLASVDRVGEIAGFASVDRVATFVRVNPIKGRVGMGSKGLDSILLGPAKNGWRIFAKRGSFCVLIEITPQILYRRLQTSNGRSTRRYEAPT